uniref:Uncharacterized protein LOC113795026 isoform X2 n=1 Tax=Dermatophagoides pteronyssinus TaxID=6956 RepID=A0A6P6Y6H8_DERPT|nr:uncharacterized protein LOC113795026 isoform X2 [Dermatophagoides pteronyssinus]
MGKLQLEFGFDDFSIVNPIGVKNVNHTYMALYLTTPTIPLKYRSKRSDIFVLMLINRAEMKRSGYELKDVLKPLIDDLKFIMEEGIEKKITDINGQTITKKFKIAVSAVCGDNKGIYELLGYHTSFTSRSFICRLCGAKAKDSELKRIGNLIDFAKIDYQKAQFKKKFAKNLTTLLKNCNILNT